MNDAYSGAAIDPIADFDPSVWEDDNRIFEDVMDVAPPGANQTDPFIDDMLNEQQSDMNITQMNHEFPDEILGPQQDRVDVPKAEQTFPDIQPLVLYSDANPFVRTPSHPPRASELPVPRDGVPWNEAELAILYKYEKKAWSTRIFVEVEAAGFASRELSIVREKHEELNRMASKPKPWNYWAKREIEFVIANNKLKPKELAFRLTLLGFNRDRTTIVNFKKARSNGTKFKQVTLEQSYDIREFNNRNIEPERAAAASHLGVKSYKLHLSELQTYGNLDPVQWTPQEDQCLMHGINKFQSTWRLVKDPLYGRSMGSSARRYEFLCRSMWSREANEHLWRRVTNNSAAEYDGDEFDSFANEIEYPNMTPLMVQVRARFFRFGPTLGSLRIPYPASTTDIVSTVPRTTRQVQTSQTRTGRAPQFPNQLYFEDSPFILTPSGPADPRVEPVPPDGVPWLSQELHVFNSMCRESWSPTVLQKARNAGIEFRIVRSEQIIQAKHAEFQRRLGRRSAPWLFWCDKDLETLRENAHLPAKQIHEKLNKLGFQRDIMSLRRALKMYKTKPQWFPTGYTLEESYEARDLYTMYPDDWAKIDSIMQVGRQDFGIPGVIMHFQRDLLGIHGPVGWTKEEDQCLLQGMQQFGRDFKSTKDPLYGRSIRSCLRRFEYLTRNLWTEEEEQRLIEICRPFLPYYPDWDQVAAMFAEPKTGLLCELRFRVMDADPDLSQLVVGSSDPLRRSATTPLQTIDPNRIQPRVRENATRDDPMRIAPNDF